MKDLVFKEINDRDLLESIVDDNLGRNIDLFNMIKIIKSISNHRVLSIESDWGSGKTFFVKQLEYIYLNYKNSDINQLFNKNPFGIEINDDDLKDVNVFYYDAWKNDSNSDPLVSLISYLINKSNYLYDFKEPNIDMKQLLTESIEKLSEKYPAISLLKSVVDATTFRNNDVKELLLKTDDEIKKDKLIKEIITSIVNKNKTVIIIDELDRCTPNFSMRLLEEIKHYFDIENLIFILVLNVKEFDKIIKQYYGNEYKGQMYLDKIIDYRLHLKSVEKDKYVDYLLNKVVNSKVPIKFIRNACIHIAEYYNLELRAINRLINIANDIFVSINIDNSINYFFEFYKGSNLTVFVIPIILIGTYLYDFDLYITIMEGKGREKFVEILTSDNEGIYNLDLSMLENDREIDNDGRIKPKDKQTRMEEIKYNLGCLYDVIFADGNTNIGKVDVNSQLIQYKDTIKKHCNILKCYAYFN